MVHFGDGGIVLVASPGRAALCLPRHVLPAFAPAFDRIGDATSHELNAYWFAQNTSVPLAAFDPAFAAKMRDPSSAERRGAAAALAAGRT